MKAHRPWKWIASGYHRDNLAAGYGHSPRGGRWLRAAGPPRIGDAVAIQITYTRAFKSVIEDYSTWAVLRGNVTHVVDADTVEATLYGATDGYAACFPVQWAGRLVRHRAYVNPWLLESLEPYPAESVETTR